MLNLNIWSKLFVFAGILILAACENDKEVPQDDFEPPSIVLVNPPDPEVKIWGNHTFDAQVEDNTGVTRVEWYLDNTLIGENVAAPYSHSLVAEDYQDGPHILKIIAYDGEGNSSETTLEITIFNKLLKIATNGTFRLKEFGNADWVFLSDHSGNILGIEELQPNSELIFDRPEDFDEQDFMVHFVNVELDVVSGAPYTRVHIYSMEKISPDEWELDNIYIQDKLGEGVVVVNDIPEGYSNSFGSNMQGHLVQTTAPLSTSFQLNYSLYGQNEPVYTSLTLPSGAAVYNLTELNVGGQTTIPFPEFIALEQERSVVLPETNNHVTVEMLVDPDDYYNGSYSIWNQPTTSAGEIKVRYPEGYNTFLTILNHTVDGYSYSFQTVGDIPGEFELPSVSISVENSSPTDFSMSISGGSSGEFDRYKADWGYNRLIPAQEFTIYS